MCLAIPARVVDLRGDIATVDMEGIRRDVSVMLVPDVKKGEYVIVHAGFAIGKLDAHEAEENLRLIREALGANDVAGPDRVSGALHDKGRRNVSREKDLEETEPGPSGGETF